MKRYIGIDPGTKDSGLTVIDINFGLPEITYIGPYCKMTLSLYAGPNTVVCIERSTAAPKMGAVSAFNYGVAYGKLLSDIEHLNWHSVISVTPAAWKAKFGLLKKPKSASVKKVKQRFNTSLTKEQIKELDHHMADSALIALFVYEGV